MTAPAGFRLAGPALDEGQREVLGQALADALQWREPAVSCADCEALAGEALCPDHEADLTLTGAYRALAAELGIGLEADR